MEWSQYAATVVAALRAFAAGIRANADITTDIDNHLKAIADLQPPEGALPPDASVTSWRSALPGLVRCGTSCKASGHEIAFNDCITVLNVIGDNRTTEAVREALAYCEWGFTELDELHAAITLELESAGAGELESTGAGVADPGIPPERQIVLTMKQVANRHDVDERTIRRYVKSGSLKRISKGNTFIWDSLQIPKG